MDMSIIDFGYKGMNDQVLNEEMLEVENFRYPLTRVSKQDLSGVSRLK
jgi:hypothetical protein